MSLDDIVCRKLVRDKIPEIIRQCGKEPVVRHLDEKAFREAVGRKVLEEAFELFTSWRKGEPE